MKRPTADQLAAVIVCFCLFLILLAEAFDWWGPANGFFLGLAMGPLYLFLLVAFKLLGCK